MYERKYESYNVKVIFQSKSEHYFNKDKDITNYKEMMEQYRIVRDKHKTNRHVARIEFIGVNIGGEAEIIFSKEMNNNKLKKEVKMNNTENKDNEGINENSIMGILKNIIENLKVLQERRDYISNKTSATDKSQDIILHKIESLKELKDNKIIELYEYNNHRLELYDKLEDCREMRRSYKVEQGDIDSIIKTTNINKTIATYENILKKIECKKKREYNYMDENFINKKYREVGFLDEEDKKNKIEKLSKHYRKVVTIGEIIYAYNTVYK